MPSPHISVILAAYNAQAYLQQSVRSVLDPSYTDLEVIVVDDGSSDGTAAVCRSLAADDRRVKLISQPNAGISAARNRGLAAAAGEWISVIDADDLWRPGKLARQLSVTQQAKNRVVLCDTRRFSENADGGIEWLTASNPPDWTQRPEYQRQLLMLPANRMQSFNTALMRTRDARALGGWNEKLISAQDWDFWCRASGQAEIVRLPDELYLYRKHAGSDTRTGSMVKVLDSQLAVTSSFAKTIGVDVAKAVAWRRLQFLHEAALHVPRRWLIAQLFAVLRSVPRLGADARFRQSLVKALAA